MANATQPEDELQRKVGRFPLKRSIGLFVLLTALGLGLIVHRTGGVSFVWQAFVALGRAPSMVAVLVGLLCLEWYSDYLRYQVLARQLDIHVPPHLGVEVVFGNLLFSYLTPGGTFGAPAVIYMLAKEGIPVSRAVALAIIKPLFTFLVMLASGSVIFAVVDVPFSPTTRHILMVSSGVILGLAALIVSLIVFPAASRRLVGRTVAWLRRVLRARRARETPRLDGAERGIGATIDAFALLGKSGWRGLTAVLVTTIANLTLFIGVSVVLLYALGFAISGREMWLYSYVYYFLVAFAPTPGASGLAEGGGYVLLEGVGSPTLVGSYVVLWRLFSCYLVMLIGAVLFARFLRRVRAR